MSELKVEDIQYISYSGEKDLHLVSSLIEKELSEPYSVFTYRYFVNQWPELCILAMAGAKSVGTIVCKLEDGKNRRKRGYIGMLAVDPAWRGKRIASHLVEMAVNKLKELHADEVALETELTNKASISLYEKLGFSRTKLLKRYYMNGNDAYRLKLFITPPPDPVMPQVQ